MKVETKIYQYGDTVRLKCVFFDFNGEKINPSLVKVIIYDSRYQIMQSEVLGAINVISVGEYFFDYITERKEQKMFYEWYGEIEGTPSLKRGTIMTKFI